MSWTKRTKLATIQKGGGVVVGVVLQSRTWPDNLAVWPCGRLGQPLGDDNSIFSSDLRSGAARGNARAKKEGGGGRGRGTRRMNREEAAGAVRVIVHFQSAPLTADKNN